MIVSPAQDEKDLRIRELQETMRDVEADDETIQPSINDRKAQMMVENNIKVCDTDNSYRILEPLKDDVVVDTCLQTL